MISADIATRLDQAARECPGRLSVSVRTDDGSRWAHDDDHVVPAASTIKLAVLLAALASGMPLDASVPLPPSAQRVGGCGPLAMLPSVTALPAGELATLMIACSDNDATCASDRTELLARLRVGRLLDPAGTRHAIEVLRQQQFVDGLAGFLGPDVSVGSKTGMMPGLRHDLALVERGDRWVAVAVLATGLIDVEGVDRGSAVIPVFARIGEIAAEMVG